MVMNANDINSRREFNEYFDESLKRANWDLGDDLKFDPGQNLPKAYVVEYHPRSHDASDRRGLIASVRGMNDLECRETADETFFVLSNADTTFFVDAIDPRFILLHTLSDSTSADEFVNRHLTGASPSFDLSWFTEEFLEGLASAAPICEGWETRFARLNYEKADQQAHRIPESFSISDSGQNALHEYQEYKQTFQSKEFALETLLLATATDGMYGRARVKSEGKITARGNSHQCFLNLVTLIQKKYAAYVQKLESEYSLHFEPAEAGYRICGKPFWLEFSRPVNHLKALLEFMFSCSSPFRLMGTPQWLSDDFARVRAVDLHVGRQMSFEITPRYMRIYLTKGCCGNSLARIVSQLQRCLDSRLRTAEDAA